MGFTLVEETCVSTLGAFEPLTEINIEYLVTSSPNAFSTGDPIPIWAVRFIDRMPREYLCDLVFIRKSYRKLLSSSQILLYVSVSLMSVMDIDLSNYMIKPSKIVITVKHY